MSRQQKPSRQVSVDEQVQVVSAVLKGEWPLAGAACRHGVSPAAVQLRIHHARLTSPSNTAISVWPLADPLLDRRSRYDQ